MHRVFIFTVFACLSTNVDAGIIATVDFASGAETITFTGEDRGGMAPIGDGFYLLEWRRDLLPPDRTGSGSDGDSTGDVFEGLHVASDTDLSFSFDFRAFDAITQFTLEPSDYVYLRARVRSTSLELSTDVIWRGSGQPIDISNWDSMTLWNLQEAINAGSLPLTAGSRWNPVIFQAASTASVPEPSSLMLLVTVAMYFLSRDREIELPKPAKSASRGHC